MATRQLGCGAGRSTTSPPGRESAQQQALDRIEQEPPSKRGWWCFEGITRVDCLLAAHLVTVGGKRTEPLSSATDWYPARSQLVRAASSLMGAATGAR